MRCLWISTRRGVSHCDCSVRCGDVQRVLRIATRQEYEARVHAFPLDECL